MHLTEGQMEGYRSRQLAAEDLLAVADHLACCSDCRRQMAQSTGAMATLGQMAVNLDAAARSDTRHSSLEELSAHMEERWSDLDRSTVEAHLAACSSCRAELDDLREARGALFSAAPKVQEISQHPRTRFGWPLGAVAAGLAIVAFTAGLWLTTGRQAPNVPAAPDLIALRDGSGTIRLDAQGKLVTSTALSPEDASLLRTVLTQRRFVLPSSIGSSGASETLLGAADPSSVLRIEAPVSTAVFSDRPNFRWTSAGDGARYRAQVYDSDFQLVIESPLLAETEWQASRPLPRGRTYRWQVVATVRGRTVQAPAPPAPEAKFYLLSGDQSRNIAAARQQHPDAHLLLAALLAKAGARDEAGRELDALAGANPDSPAIRQLRESLQPGLPR